MKETSRKDLGEELGGVGEVLGEARELLPLLRVLRIGLLENHSKFFVPIFIELCELLHMLLVAARWGQRSGEIERLSIKNMRQSFKAEI